MFYFARDRINLDGEGLLVMSDLGPVGVPGGDTTIGLDEVIDRLWANSRRVGSDPFWGLAQDELPRAHALFDFLQSAGLVRLQPAPVVGQKIIGGGRYRGALGNARVAIVGTAPWVATAALELVAGGVEHIIIYGTPPVSADGVEIDSKLFRSSLPQIAPIRCFEVLDREMPTLSELTNSEDQIVVIGAAAPSRLDIQIATERACRAAAVPFIGAEILGRRAVIGPVSLAARPGCWLCAKLRLVANSHDPWAAHKHFQLAMKGHAPAASGADDSEVRIVGRTVASVVLRILKGGSAGALVGNVLVRDCHGTIGSLHPFLAMPWCEVCGGARAAKRFWFAADPGQQYVDCGKPETDVLNAYVDTETGIVAAVRQRDRHDGEPLLPYVAVALPSNFCDPAESWLGEVALGKGMCRAEAQIGAIGEAIERYAASRYDPDTLVERTMCDLEGDYLDPRDTCLYGDAQYSDPAFPFRPFDPRAPHKWVQGRWIDSGRSVWVAAAQVFYRFRASFDDFFAQVTTSGLAAGAALDDAQERAVLELIERDATMLTWLSLGRGKRFVVSPSDGDITLITDALIQGGLSIEMYLLDGVAGVPVVLCLAFGDGRAWPGACATSAAGLDVRAAARSAMMELGMTVTSLRRKMHTGDGDWPKAPPEVRAGYFVDHAAYYIPPREGELDFLRSPLSAAVPLDALETSRVDSLALPGALRQTGIRLAVIDVTPPDIACGPARVVRAVATHLQPLHCGFGMERLASERLQQRSRGSINRRPHPFC